MNKKVEGKREHPPQVRQKFWRRIPWYVKGIFIVVSAFLLVTGGGLIFLTQNPEQAALFADNVLRPLLGDKAVIALEGWAFAAQDKVNHARYSQPVAANYQLAVSAAPVTPVPSASTTPTAHLATPKPVPPPGSIDPTPLDSSPLPHEGEWLNIAGTSLDTTFLRTDPTRPYAVVNLVHIPLSVLGIASVAGTKYPGGPAGPGKIPDSVQQSNNLVAAFNGGFQQKDGNYGMYTDGTTYVPLRKGIGTLFIYQDGHVAISTYTGQPLTPDIIAARQNGPLMVNNGKDSVNIGAGTDLWAGTASGDFVTWRSGLGITAKGDLIYAVGPSLTPPALADALRMAGSVNAIELDVNAFWVRFMVYQPKGNGTYTWSTLVKGLADGGQAYLSGYEKDFFYLYKK